jgi:hypothetical protein
MREHSWISTCLLGGAVIAGIVACVIGLQRAEAPDGILGRQRRAEQLGREAFHAGKDDLHDNPFSNRSELYDSWLKGYVSEQENAVLTKVPNPSR